MACYIGNSHSSWKINENHSFLNAFDPSPYPSNRLRKIYISGVPHSALRQAPPAQIGLKGVQPAPWGSAMIAHGDDQDSWLMMADG